MLRALADLAYTILLKVHQPAKMCTTHAGLWFLFTKAGSFQRRTEGANGKCGVVAASDLISLVLLDPRCCAANNGLQPLCHIVHPFASPAASLAAIALQALYGLSDSLQSLFTPSLSSIISSISLFS